MSTLRKAWHLLPPSFRHKIGGDLIDRSYVAVSRVFDRWMDRRYGISTCGATSAGPRSRFGDSNRNLSTDYLRLFVLRRRLRLGKEDRLVDLGCGYGRVLFAFAPDVGHALGIELHAPSYAVFEQNIARFAGPKNVSGALADCAEFKFENENVFYLFNPFGRETMQAVFENIRSSVLQHPRHIRVVCFFESGPLISQQSWLHQTSSVMILRKEYLIFENDGQSANG